MRSPKHLGELRAKSLATSGDVTIQRNEKIAKRKSWGNPRKIENFDVTVVHEARTSITYVPMLIWGCYGYPILMAAKKMSPKRAAVRCSGA